MKSIMLFLLGFVAFSGATALGLPPRQHRVDGKVQSLDRGKLVLVLAPAAKSQPDTFVIEPDRTRFRRDGKKATFGQLSNGEAVRVYYKLEAGEHVATEISWESATPPQPTPERRDTSADNSSRS